MRDVVVVYRRKAFKTDLCEGRGGGQIYDSRPSRYASIRYIMILTSHIVWNTMKSCCLCPRIQKVVEIYLYVNGLFKPDNDTTDIKAVLYDFLFSVGMCVSQLWIFVSYKLSQSSNIHLHYEDISSSNIIYRVKARNFLSSHFERRYQ